MYFVKYSRLHACSTFLNNVLNMVGSDGVLVKVGN